MSAVVSKPHVGFVADPAEPDDSTVDDVTLDVGVLDVGVLAPVVVGDAPAPAVVTDDELLEFELHATAHSAIATTPNTRPEPRLIDPPVKSGNSVDGVGDVDGEVLMNDLASITGVRRVEPMAHRFAYVGADLQDIFGVRPSTIGRAAQLQDAYFGGGSADKLMSPLARQPDGLIVSAETVKDFQLSPGDQVRLRLRDSGSGQLTDVSFHYLGMAKEFPTAPRDSFLVAYSVYLDSQTGRGAPNTLLITTGTANPAAVAKRVRARVGTTNAVGPAPFTPGGPEVIIGGFVPAAMRRAGRMAHGVRSFAFAADTRVHLERYALTKEAWDESGRPGRPRLVAACNFALGPHAHDAFVKHAHTYYGYDQALLDDALSSNAPTSPKAILEFIAKFEADGIDELVFTTVTADTMTAMRELAEVVASR